MVDCIETSTLIINGTGILYTVVCTADNHDVLCQVYDGLDDTGKLLGCVRAPRKDTGILPFNLGQRFTTGLYCKVDGVGACCSLEYV